MKKLFISICLALGLTGCATFESPIPAGYTGPMAVIKDSAKAESPRKADIFFLSKIDQLKIKSSLVATRTENRGKGMSMAPVVLDRKVPAQSATFTITGRTEYAAPILALTNPVYEVSGEVTFVPEKDKNYIVVGELGEKYSAVWIKEAESDKVVGEKVENKGSAELGFFQK